MIAACTRSESLDVIFARKLPDAACQLQFEERCKNFGGAEFRLKLFHDLVKLKRLVVAKHRHHASFVGWRWFSRK